MNHVHPFEIEDEFSEESPSNFLLPEQRLGLIAEILAAIALRMKREKSKK